MIPEMAFASHLFIQPFRADPVQRGEVGVDDDQLSAS